MSKQKIEKDIISLYLPTGLVDIIDKRALKYFFNRSKQIQFDLLNYYKQIGCLPNNENEEENE